jgi:hypothetical protein
MLRESIALLPICDREVSAVRRCVLCAPSTTGCANSVHPV